MDGMNIGAPMVGVDVWEEFVEVRRLRSRMISSVPGRPVEQIISPSVL
jgi:hypothetical protein